MSHSRIFQLATKPIADDEHVSPDEFYENSGDFAEYIGDEVTDGERDEDIGHLADTLKDVFTPVGRGVLAYKGRDALLAFKAKWLEAINKFTDGLTAENMTADMRMFRLKSLTEETHLSSSYRVCIQEWSGLVAEPISELFEWAESELQEGDRVYVGAVIDYHY